MFRTFRVLCLFLLSASPLAAEQGPPVPTYPADKVAENVYVIHGPLGIPNPQNQGFMNNPGIVITDAGVVLVDPGGSLQSGEMVLRVVSELTNKPVVAVFNTHVHGDHWLGNQAVRAAYPTVPIFAHAQMILSIEDGEGESWVELMDQLTQGKTKGTTVVGPDEPVDHGDQFEIGELTFRIHHYGQAHTFSDLMIEIVESGVVFLGDNILNGRIPRIDEGDIAGNIKACAEISKSGARVYVPGHGRTSDQSIVESMHTYFDTLYSVVKRLYDDGLSDFEMKDDVSTALKDYAHWAGFDTQLGRHISLAYLQIEATDF